MPEILHLENIDIEIIRTKNKNAYLRIYPENPPRVAARIPFSMADDSLRRFLRAKMPWMQKHLQALSAQKPEGMPEISLQAGGSVPLWGKEIALLFLEQGEKSVGRVGNTLVFQGMRPDSPDVHALFASFIAGELEKKTRQYLPGFCQKLRVTPPAWRFRKMRSRWGSCHVQKRIITINAHLSMFEEEYLAYVIAHELCHLRVPNHSKAFYAQLGEICPEWKAIRQTMKTFVLPQK